VSETVGGKERKKQLQDGDDKRDHKQPPQLECLGSINSKSTA